MLGRLTSGELGFAFAPRNGSLVYSVWAYSVRLAGSPPVSLASLSPLGMNRWHTRLNFGEHGDCHVANDTALESVPRNDIRKLSGIRK